MLVEIFLCSAHHKYCGRVFKRGMYGQLSLIFLLCLVLPLLLCMVRLIIIMKLREFVLQLW